MGVGSRILMSVLLGAGCWAMGHWWDRPDVLLGGSMIWVAICLARMILGDDY